MAKKGKISPKTVKKRVNTGVILLVATAGGILFSFGLLDWFKELGVPAWVPVLIGAVTTIVLIVFGMYTTETATAMKRK